MDLSGARIGVTGAAGFIGAAVTARLRAEGTDVAAVDRVPAEGLIHADTTDARAVAAALQGCDGVVHAAALLGDRGGATEQVRVNVHGTRNVLDAAGDAQVVHLSSVAAWGYEFRGDLPSEDAPVRQTGHPYGDTKAASDVLARRRGAVVVRPGDVYGPRSEPWVLRPLRALRAGRFALPGRGEGVITPVFLDDLVDLLVRALGAPHARGRAYVAHDGEPLPARDFFAHHVRWLGRTRVPVAPAALLRLGATAAAAADRLRGREPDVTPEALVYVSRGGSYPCVRAREELGWRPQVALAEGMARCEAWARREGLLD